MLSHKSFVLPIVLAGLSALAFVLSAPQSPANALAYTFPADAETLLKSPLKTNFKCDGQVGWLITAINNKKILRVWLTLGLWLLCWCRQCLPGLPHLLAIGEWCWRGSGDCSLELHLRQRNHLWSGHPHLQSRGWCFPLWGSTHPLRCCWVWQGWCLKWLTWHMAYPYEDDRCLNQTNKTTRKENLKNSESEFVYVIECPISKTETCNP